MGTSLRLFSAGLASTLIGWGVGARAEPLPVDVELVLAVDVSWSMDRGEQAIQRDGYEAAFRSPEVQEAILNGTYGRIAVTYVEWAGQASQTTVVPWTLIDSKQAADAFAYRLSIEEPERERRTSISSAIDFAATLFGTGNFEGLRRVVDVSGDGPNNEGRPVTDARDAAVTRGLVINGLPLMTSGIEGATSWGGIADLDRYYAQCVIGGPGAFIVPVHDWAQFPEAVRRKLVLELAGLWPSIERDRPETVPVQAREDDEVDCLAGERMWRQRQDRWGAY